MPQDKEALLRKLIEAYSRMYMKMAYDMGVPYDDAEDIVLDAYWSFYRSKYFGCLDERGTKAMLARIVTNKCIDLFRKNQRENKKEEKEELEELDLIRKAAGMDPLQDVIAGEQYQDVIRCMEAMKKIWRDVAVMYFIEGLSVNEICRRLEISESVCRSRISRARRYLKEALKKRWETS